MIFTSGKTMARAALARAVESAHSPARP